MDIINKTYYDKCIKAGMCQKGIDLWNTENALIDFAKEECEFIINNRPLTHTEMLSMYNLSLLNSHNAYIDQDLDNLIETTGENPTSLFLGCTGIIRLFEDSNIVNIADESKLQVKIFSDGMTTIRLYTGSEIDLFVENICSVLIFNYGGKCNIKSAKDFSRITEKIMRK